MPIVKTEKTLQVQFGTGDILIGSGMLNDYDEGLVSLVPHAPHPIGTFVKHENPNMLMEDIPVALIFKNTNSLDVLIERLQTTRKYMTGELDVHSDPFITKPNDKVKIENLPQFSEWKERWNNGDIKFVPELFEIVDHLQKEITEIKCENIGVALYETKLLHEKLSPEEHSNVDRHFKHIIKTLEQ